MTTQDNVQTTVREMLGNLWENLARTGKPSGLDLVETGNFPGSTNAFLVGMFMGLYISGALPRDEVELWELRLNFKCPGHNSQENPKDTCHYCCRNLLDKSANRVHNGPKIDDRSGKEPPQPRGEKK